MPKYLHILDNGHGKETPGKRSPVWSDGSQLMEYEFNRAIVELVRGQLEGKGIKYHVLVPELKDVSLSERVDRAIRVSEDLSSLKPIYYSIHANAAAATSAYGIEVFTSKGQTQSDEVAEIILEELKNLSGGIKMRHDNSDGDMDKEANFYVLRKTPMPAVLLELGFMTHKDECQLLANPLYRKLLASLIVNSIIRIENEV